MTLTSIYWLRWIIEVAAVFLSNLNPAPTIADIQNAYETALIAPGASALPGLRVTRAQCFEGRRGSFLCEVKYSSTTTSQNGTQTDLVAIERKSNGEWILISGLCRPVE